MIGHTAQARPGFSISPFVVIGAIFFGLCVVEGLLAARFWLQFATAGAPDGVRGLVLDTTRPLVTPFADAHARAGDSAGFFDRRTVLAAMAYFGGAIILVMATAIAGGLRSGSDVLDREWLRRLLQAPHHYSPEHSGARLLVTATLSMSPFQATRALHMLHLDRSRLNLYVIPVSGGSVIAAFVPRELRANWPIIGSIVYRRELHLVRRIFRAIELRFRPRDAHAA